MKYWDRIKEWVRTGREAFVKNWNRTPEQAKNELKQQFGFLSGSIKTELGISQKEADMATAAAVYGEMMKKGRDPQELWDEMPKEFQEVMIYSPDELKTQQTITLAGTGITIGALLGAGIAVLFGAGLPAIGALTGIAIAAQIVVNNLNDVFHWGELMTQNNIQDLEKAALQVEGIGITEYGEFSATEIKTLSDTYQRNTIYQLKDIFTNKTYNTDISGVKEALKSIITTLNGQGVVPTKAEVIRLLSDMAVVPTDKSLSTTAQEALGAKIKAGETGAGPALPKTTITQQAKLFMGTIFSGRLAPISVFKRKVDDKITSDADLLDDAVINLARWLETLPGKLTFEIQIKNNPFDAANVRMPGVWAVLSLYINNRYHKRMFIDDVLLGPMDPVEYYPETKRTLTITGQLPDFAKYAKFGPKDLPALQTSPGGFTPEAGVGSPATDVSQTPTAPETTEPTKPPVSTPTTPKQPPTMPPVASQPPKPTYTGPVGTWSVVWQRQNRDLDIIVDGNIVKTLPSSALNESNEIAQMVAKDYVGRIQESVLGSLSAVIGEVKKLRPEYFEAKPSTPADDAAKTTFEGGYEGYKITDQYVNVNVNVLMVRAGPSTAKPLSGSERLYNGQRFKAVGWVYGQEVENENRWWVSWKGNYVWVGGTRQKP